MPDFPRYSVSLDEACGIFYDAAQAAGIAIDPDMTTSAERFPDLEPEYQDVLRAAVTELLDWVGVSVVSPVAELPPDDSTVFATGGAVKIVGMPAPPSRPVSQEALDATHLQPRPDENSAFGLPYRRA